MRVKCGVDIIEINRIQESIEKLGDTFLNKVYTQKEIEYCESKGKNKYQHYAARFAVKEAAFKAVSESVEDKFAISWKDIEITNDEQGRPKTEILFLKNKKNIYFWDKLCEKYNIQELYLFNTDSFLYKILKKIGIVVLGNWKRDIGKYEKFIIFESELISHFVRKKVRFSDDIESFENIL